MKKTWTYEKILNLHMELKKISECILPRKMSYAISRNLQALQKEADVFEAQKKDIADRYALKDEAGQFVLKYTGNIGMYQFADGEKNTAFNKELAELRTTEVEIDVFVFVAEEIDKCYESENYAILTPAQEAGIAWMIDYSDGAEVAPVQLTDASKSGKTGKGKKK